MTARRPRDYVGTNHETIGSDILAVLGAVPLGGALAGRFPALASVRRVQTVEPNGWYPIAWLLDIMEELDTALGRSALLQMGRKLYRLTHADRVAATARSAKDIVYGIDAMYHHANRGTAIGGWRVTTFAPGRAELEKTTPHHCVVEEGILREALTAVGASSVVTQTACLRRDADACHYVVESLVPAKYWSGT